MSQCTRTTVRHHDEALVLSIPSAGCYKNACGQLGLKRGCASAQAYEPKLQCGEGTLHIHTVCSIVETGILPLFGQIRQ